MRNSSEQKIGDAENMGAFNNLSAIENRIFFYLCIFAATISMPKEISNTMLILALLGIFHRLIIKRDDVVERIRNYRLLISMVILVWVTVILSVFTHPDVWKHFVYFIRVPFFYATGLFAVVLFVKEKKRLMFLWILATLSIFCNDVYSIWQFYPNNIGFQAESHAYGRYSGWLQYMVQATQITMWFPGAIMILMWMISSISGRDVLSEKDQGQGRLPIAGKTMAYMALFLAFSIVVAAVAFLANGTRGAWLATILLVVLLPLFAVRSKLRYIILVLLCLGGLMCGHYGGSKDNIFVDRLMSSANVNDFSQQGRIYVWTGAYNMYKDNPVLGVGYERFEEVYIPHYKPKEAVEELSHAHNNFLHTMAEQGTVGLFGMLAMIIIGTYAGIRSYIHSRRIFGLGSLPSICALCFLAVLWGVVLHGLTEYTFGASITLKVFWFLMAIFYVYCNECIQDRKV